MTRRQKQRVPKKGGGVGVLRSMRSGVQRVASGVTGSSDDAAAAKKPKSRVWSILSNVLSGVLIVVAAAVMLRRCGVVKF